MMLVTVAAMVALLPLGLNGVAAGLSVGAVAGAIYAVFSFARVVSLPVRRIWAQVWAPAAAAVLMAGALYPIEHLVLQASTHGVVAGLALLALEGVLGGALYVAALSLLAPPTGAAILRLPAMMLTRARGRGGGPAHGRARTTPGRPMASIVGARVPDPAHTVIVPAYNAAGTLELAIRSVRAQTDSSFELIAVDDGSTDATPDLLQRLAGEDARIRVIRQENAGPSAAREAAMGQASGTYLTFLDSDDLLMPSYLETMAETLGADAEIGLAHARGWVLDDAVGGGRVRRAVWPPPGNVTGSDADPADPVVALASGNYIGAVQTARRSAVVRAGGLDAGLDQAEDYDLWLRIAIAGFRIVSAPGHARRRPKSRGLALQGPDRAGPRRSGGVRAHPLGLRRLRRGPRRRRGGQLERAEPGDRPAERPSSDRGAR